MAYKEFDQAYIIDHQGQTLSRYKIINGNHIYFRRAYDAADAIERIADQYGWGNLHNYTVDTDTRGDLVCEGYVGWAGREIFLSAIHCPKE